MMKLARSVSAPLTPRTRRPPVAPGNRSTPETRLNPKLIVVPLSKFVPEPRFTKLVVALTVELPEAEVRLMVAADTKLLAAAKFMFPPQRELALDGAPSTTEPPAALKTKLLNPDKSRSVPWLAGEAEAGLPTARLPVTSRVPAPVIATSVTTELVELPPMVRLPTVSVVPAGICVTCHWPPVDWP